jgi:hypothetical protein
LFLERQLLSEDENSCPVIFASFVVKGIIDYARIDYLEEIVYIGMTDEY